MITELCKLAEKYGTDKVVSLRHSYTPLYDSLLSQNRLKVKKVLEIGIGTPRTMSFLVDSYKKGASLLMWRDYFPNATIYGIDIDKNAMMDEDRIDTYVCNQADPFELSRFIEKVGKDFDLIVDDGSHKTDDQIISFNILHHYLTKNGYYFIEDVVDSERIAKNLYYAKFDVHTFNMKLNDDEVMVYRHDS